MRSTLLLAALAAGAVNALERRVYETDWTTVTVTKTVTAPAVTETVPAAQQAQVVYETSTESAAPAETEHSDLFKKSTVIVRDPATDEAQPAESTTYWSTAWTSTIQPEPAPTTLSTSTSSAPEASATPANAYQQAVLYNHNVHRSNHSAPSVDWDSSLESSARALAAKCVYQHDT